MFKHFHEIETFFTSRKNFGIKPGLERIYRLMEMTDYPQNKMKAVHVAGTNGKGSTIHFIKNALTANGYKVGVFTSPSLDGLTGHIFCNDKPIDKGVLVTLMNEICPAVQLLDKEENHPTAFEIITTLAFVYFSRHVDIALIETGMGGREDTTNCFQPLVSIITNVALDHTAFLGNSLKEIASHKAGIIKVQTPVIVGEIEHNAMAVIDQEAKSKQAPMDCLPADFTFEIEDSTPAGQKFTWTNGVRRLHVTIAMHGEHQIINASLAIMALVHLKKKGVSHEWVKSLAGIYHTKVPGRFEIIQNDPTIIVDGAHNPAGIQSFLQTAGEMYGTREKHLIFAAFKDKDLKTMLHQLTPYFTSITLTSFAHPRAADAHRLFQLTDSEEKMVVADWKEAIQGLPKEPHPHNSLYFITGSLHFIANVRKYFENS